MQTFNYESDSPRHLANRTGCEPLSSSTWYQESRCAISRGLRSFPLPSPSSTKPCSQKHPQLSNLVENLVGSQGQRNR